MGLHSSLECSLALKHSTLKVCWFSGTGKGHKRRSKWDVEGRSRQQSNI